MLYILSTRSKSERNLVSTAQSMTLAHLTIETVHTYIHPEDPFFYFYTLHYNNFFLTSRTVKISILLSYNLGMRYQLSLLSTRLSRY